ncbi:cation:proton antiporter [Candidatus Sumerlaeota bacterium]|nr:cation:proton antiporter [Candidatus Sumerlaeota bacterium]
MEFWSLLLDILVLLALAMALGAVFEAMRQSAILGYLLAGALLGPHTLHIVSSEEVMHSMAELGVALLLFSIGLEISWRRLRSLGSVAFVGGTLQLAVTAIAATLLMLALGQGLAASLAIGAIVAPSSTACVLRILTDRTEMDSVHGRASLGILLLQDIALVPLVLFVSTLGGEGTAGQVVLEVLEMTLLGALLVGGLLVFSHTALPRLLGSVALSRNRELPILLAIVTCLGATWLSHELGLSPALGAFVAGMFLAESPFATQIRSDVGPLRTVFVTLFFASIGMVANPAWIVEHLPLVLITLIGVIVGKAAIIWAVVRLLGRSECSALATGLCLGQIGEFSFVLAQIALAGSLLTEWSFQLLVAVAVLTLLLTPGLVALAVPTGRRFELVMRRLGLARADLLPEVEQPASLSEHVILVGFGPSGQIVKVALDEARIPTVIVELNPRSVQRARAQGHTAHLGDATHAEVLHHVGVEHARAVIVSIPDHRAAREITMLTRVLAPHTLIIARARHHIHSIHLMAAGAEVVVDEEREVGRRIGAAAVEEITGIRLPPDLPV